jgi:hypothetical protein
MAANTASLIDRFITPGSPLAKAGGARLLLKVTGGNVAGAAALAAIAKKESEFGRTAGKFKNNYWGWGVHLGPSVYTSPSVEAGAAKVWKGLNSGLYKGAGINTLPAIIQKYAPPSENNTTLYRKQISEWMQQLGVNPNTNIFNGSGGTAPADAGAVPPAAPASLPQEIAGQIDVERLRMLLNNQTKRSLRGIMPAEGFRGELQKLAQQSLPRAVETGSSPDATTPLPTTGDTAGLPPALAAQNPGPDGLFGFSSGGVDSGKAFRGGNGGDWGGSMPRALALARAVGATPSSEKRSRRLTASGNPSDHWVGSTNSYATDLPTSGAAGDALFAKVAKALGVKLTSGQWNNVNIGGYRYQVGWRVPGHYDHVHVGVKKI